METWIYAILIIVLIFLIWNTVILYQLKRQSKEPLSSLKDERYFDLKYRINYFIAAGSILVFLFAYVGMDTKKGLEENIAKELISYTKKFAEVDSLSGILEKSLTSYNDSITKLMQKQLQITERFDKEQKDLDNIEQQYDILKNEILNNPIIHVAKAKIKRADFKHDTDVKVYYKDCINLITNENLSSYRNKPFVLIHLDKFSTFPREVTTDYFTVNSMGTRDDYNPKSDFFEFSFIIFSY